MNDKKQNFSCLCKFLEKIAQDSSVPVEYDKETENFFILLSPIEKCRINFCFFCGGKDMNQITEENKKCDCNSVVNWSQTPAFPIKHDSEYQEYHLLGRRESKISIYYCPVCGGQLPKTKRGDFFTTPSDEEMNELTAKLKGINKIEDFVKMLGTPDHESGAIKASKTDKEVYGLRDIKRTLAFNSIAKTLNLIVQEYEDGEVFCSFAGKPKKADKHRKRKM